MASPIISPLGGLAFPQQGRLTNWAGNITYSSDSVFYPETTEEVQAVIKAHEKIKGLGTKHCFNRIADSSFRNTGNKCILMQKLDEI